MNKRHILYILILGFVLASCSDTTEVERYLDAADVHMEDNPEMALETLEDIDREMLTTRKVRARFALLYTMALDKNYIDVASDSIIAPAVKYYENHGTAEDKFKTLYYTGRIYQNAGNVEAAMKKFVEAEYHISNQIDKGIIARMYKAKMVAYQSIFDYKSAVLQAHNAARYYLAANDSIRYLNAVNDIAVLYSQLNDMESQDKYIKILESNTSIMDEYQLSNYYAIRLNTAFGISDHTINDTLSEYLSVISDKSLINWLSVSKAYIVLQDFKSARIALDSYISYGGLPDPSYYWIAATLYEHLGEYCEALKYYKEYQNSTDETDVYIFESDTKFIEERYDAELKSVRQSLYIIIITLSLTIVVLVLIILAQRMKKVKEEKRIQKIKFDEERRAIVGEKEEVEARYVLIKEEKEEAERMYSSLKAEIEQLKKIRKDKSIDKDILASVEQRLNVLNMFILAELSDSFEKIAYTELGKLMENREGFLESTKKTFMISHPKFMAYLRERNLTEWEIGCCCLYCIGFNGAEISEYLNRKAIYNVNSTIRQKLDIPKGGTQIDVFLKLKMQEFHT